MVTTSSKVNKIEAHHIKRGSYIIIKNRPCKIMNVMIAKPGKHGHMKVHAVGIDVITGKKYELMCAGHIMVTQFALEKEEYQLTYMDEENLDCLNEKGKQSYLSLETTSDLYKNIKNEYDAEKTIMITTIRAPVETSRDKFIEQEKIESFKEQKEKVNS
jgi:translation initiation factor 5A